MAAPLRRKEGAMKPRLSLMILMMVVGGCGSGEDNSQPHDQPVIPPVGLVLDISFSEESAITAEAQNEIEYLRFTFSGGFDKIIHEIERKPYQQYTFPQEIPYDSELHIRVEALSYIKIDALEKKETVIHCSGENTVDYGPHNRNTRVPVTLRCL